MLVRAYQSNRGRLIPVYYYGATETSFYVLYHLGRFTLINANATENSYCLAWEEELIEIDLPTLQLARLEALIGTYKNDQWDPKSCTPRIGDGLHLRKAGEVIAIYSHMSVGDLVPHAQFHPEPSHGR